MLRWFWVSTTVVFAVLLHYSYLYMGPAMISLTITLLLFWKRKMIYRSKEKTRIMKFLHNAGGSSSLKDFDETILQELEACGLIRRIYHG